MKQILLILLEEIGRTIMAETLLRQTINITFYSNGMLHDEITDQEFDLLQLRKLA